MAKVRKKLQNHLVLNKFLLSNFGLKDVEDLRRILKPVEEGMNQHKELYFTEALQSLKIDNSFRQKLSRYDENIQKYLDHINQKRDPPIVLKYFQYISVLLTELYLDRYYNDFDSFYSDFADFINESESETESSPYPSRDNMKKLAFWYATGSGKTLIMHVNFLQIKKYSKNMPDNFLLITPNEGLSKQHSAELDASSIENARFEVHKSIEDWQLKNPLKIVEITKIKKDVRSQDGKTIPVETFGENNVIFVDEGHKGHSTEAKTWKSIRNVLVGNGGFTFEYSATFGEITEKDDTFNEYSFSIICDYRYRYFHEDGFGKDYSILNLKNREDYGDEYFTGAVLSFYEQKTYFKDHRRKIRDFNLEDPLMIFVGSSVSGKKNDSDILKVVRFLARFVNEKSVFSEHIKNILTNRSGLVDLNDKPLFESKFPYLRHLISGEIKIEDIYEDILKNLFHIKTSKTLQLIDLKNAEGEIGLRFDSEYFGVINIGDTDSFLKVVSEDRESLVQIGPKSTFEKSLFEKIEEETSPINFLIGSRKFIEGWNSYRVSSMGLLNVGKKEGTQIIQLFGRGVRLKGYGNCLKRSSAQPEERIIPADVTILKDIKVLETLNIFGLNSNYMEIFKETLKDEAIMKYDEVSLKIKPTIPSEKLYVPRSDKDTREFLKNHQIMDYSQNVPPVKLDLSPKIEVLESENRQINSVSPLKENFLDDEIIELLDFQEIYLELLKYKDLKKYSNVYFSKEDLKQILRLKKYSILCKKEILLIGETEELDKINKIQEYVIQLLKTHVDKICNHEKYMWYQKNLKYDLVTQEDISLIPDKYLFTINSVGQSVKEAKDFSSQLKSFIKKNSEDTEEIYQKDLPLKYGFRNIADFFALNVHLFKPLIYKGEDFREFDVSPVSLVESERRFIKEMYDYLNSGSGKSSYDSVYLLRNHSRRGIGFFETKNFYPDFILWTVKGYEQTINFIDPKGLTRLSPEDEKIKLHKEIKGIEQELNKKSKLNIKLNSFILSHTKYFQLRTYPEWKNFQKNELEKKNILFLEDGREFLDQMFEIILS